MIVFSPLLKKIVEIALIEDIGTWDITSALIPENLFGSFRLITKESGIFCGKAVFIEVFKQIDREIKINFIKSDGDSINKGDTISIVSGKIANILTGERTALNFVRHLSGIATTTNRLVSLIKNSKSKTKIADTRKTTPGLRSLEKYAVLCGKGLNHRHSLNAGIMIKDNHTDTLGSIEIAVKRAKQSAPATVKIEVECRNQNEVKQALNAGADIIMLDNMTHSQIAQSVSIIKDKALIEISGNITEQNISQYLNVEADWISMGSLTHSVKSLDLSLKIDKSTH